MRQIPNCVACGSKELLPFLDLGSQPLANAFHGDDEEPPCYPMTVAHCGACGHKQLTQSVPPDLMFRRYPYRSGVSEAIRQDFRQLAQQIVRRHGKCRVLDIACNDGTFLEELEAAGCEAVGVEPARNLVEIARAKGLSVEAGYWSQAASFGTIGKFDVITAINVLAHTDDPLTFLLDCRSALKPGGVIIVQTSQVHWIENGEFDCVYHEHVSYFTGASLYRLATRAGYEVQRTDYLPIHGGSRRAFLSDPLGGCAAQMKQSATDARDCVASLRERGYIVCGYGAAAKGNVRLNTANLCLDFIADDTEEKQGTFTPGMNIPVVSPERLRGIEKLAVVILAWNVSEEIITKAKALREGLKTVFIDARTWQEVKA
jgi:SAM-dependent methyltransferase